MWRTTPPTCVDERPDPGPLRQRRPPAERRVGRREDEALRESLHHPTGHHAAGAELGGHEGDEEGEDRADGHRAHQDPPGAVLLRQEAGDHLGDDVAPEEGGEDGAVVVPVVGLGRESLRLSKGWKCVRDDLFGRSGNLVIFAKNFINFIM